MVQKYKAPIRVYKYPFELVMAAYERRFPTCHLIPVFVGSDKIFENISEDGAVQVIERRCIIKVDAPYLLRKITGVDHVQFIQKNTLDRRKRVLKIEAWNETFSNHINIHELCYYRASKENWTHFEQQASLEVKQFWGFEHVVEKLAVKHYSQNVNKGAEIIEFHIKELADEDITYIAPFDKDTVAVLSAQTSLDVEQHPNECKSCKLPNHAHLALTNCDTEPKVIKTKSKNGVTVTKSFDHSKHSRCSCKPAPGSLDNQSRSRSLDNDQEEEADGGEPSKQTQANGHSLGERLLKKMSIDSSSAKKSSFTASS